MSGMPLWEALRLAHAGQADVAGLASATPGAGETSEEAVAKVESMVESTVATARAVLRTLDGGGQS